jgi:hypothetical protein
MGILGMHQASRGEIIGTLVQERGVGTMARHLINSLAGAGG